MSKKMFPNPEEVIVCGSCGIEVVCKDFPDHICEDDEPDFTKGPEEILLENL